MVWPSANEPSTLITLNCILLLTTHSGVYYELREYSWYSTQRKSKEQRRSRTDWISPRGVSRCQNIVAQCDAQNTFFFFLPGPADVTSRWHKDAHSATSCASTDFNFWFTRCFVSAGEIQGKIFLKEFKVTYTPTIYILVSLRPALSMNHCCYTKHECPSYVQWSKPARQFVR
jgi:hypothetical protein